MHIGGQKSLDNNARCSYDHPSPLPSSPHHLRDNPISSRDSHDLDQRIYLDQSFVNDAVNGATDSDLISNDDSIKPRDGQPGSPESVTFVSSMKPTGVSEESTVKKDILTTFVQATWVRITIFFMACLFTSCVYYGWQQYAQFLIKGNAYGWLCDVNDPDCEAQEKAIGTLYSVASGCEYASAVLGGLLLDHAGPRLSAAIGESLWLLGMILVACSGHAFNLYIPAMVILGSSVNIVCFPSLTTIETFPKNRGLMVGMILAAQNAATAIPPVLLALWNQHPTWTFRGIWLTYALALGLPIALLYMWALPGKRDFQNILRLQRVEVLALQKVREGAVNADNDDVSTIHGGKEQQDLEKASVDPVTDKQMVRIHQRKASWSEFFQNVTTVDMLCVAFYLLVYMSMFAYWDTVVRDAISDEISDYVAYYMPSQAVWALIVGWLCDSIRTGYVMILLSLTMCLVFGLALAPQVTGMQYFAATICVTVQCFVYEIKYTYVAEMFDPYNFGKLVGCLGVVGGIGTWLNIAVSKGTNYPKVFLIYCILCPVFACLAAYLVWRQKRGVTYKTLPELVEDKSPEAYATREIVASSIN